MPETLGSVAIATQRYRDGRPWRLEIVRDGCWWADMPSRRESWNVYARTEQEAHKTVDYHFGRSVLWYRLAATPAPTPGESDG